MKILLFTTLLCFITEVHSSKEQCLKGSYHKDEPSAETTEYKFCTPWRNLTCCTQQLDNEVARGDSPQKYNSTWHRCGNLSSECTKFWKRQECFYQCSPYIYKWQHDIQEDAVKGVPICSDQCDAWYKACENDLICTKNALETDLNMGNVCPRNKNCTTYKKMYGNGKELCEELWGDSYVYTQPNKEKDNCMVFWFSPGSNNPNINIDITNGGSQNLPFSLTFSFLSVVSLILLCN